MASCGVLALDVVCILEKRVSGLRGRGSYETKFLFFVCVCVMGRFLAAFLLHWSLVSLDGKTGRSYI